MLEGLRIYDARVDELLAIDGSRPVAIRLADVTPEGHATQLFAVVLDYGWCETLIGSELERRAEAVAIALGTALGIPFENSQPKAKATPG